MRIFLSYGHDSNEELVRCIKADLEKRGHDVWFDKSEIRFGDDWRRAITDGIVGSNRVLSFLSKHSTRDPGVCLDELAIAIGVKGGNIQTILVESETDVKPPPTIGHIQWLDMHDWKGWRAAGGTQWEEWYRAKFNEIVRVVESDESRRFAGEIETLSSRLQPISPDSRISALLRKGFVGRAWLFDAVEKWRTGSDRSSRIFWIVGAPGVGKSAFAAHLTHFGRDKVVAAQFVEWDKPDHRSAQRVVRSIAYQLATRFPDYRKLLLKLPEIVELDRKDASELFDYLIVNPLLSVLDGGRGRCLIVIDALDEAGESGRNQLVELLARDASRLPEWMGIVVTSRPESAVESPMQGLKPFLLDGSSAANRLDLQDYLCHQLAAQIQGRPEGEQLVGQILDKSGGVFLYLERFCDDVRGGRLSLDHPDQFPQGLGGAYYQWFQRQFPNLDEFRKSTRPALRAVLAACEPLPLGILQNLFDWKDEEVYDFAARLGSLFPLSGKSGDEVIKPYHKSLAEWIGDRQKAVAYFASVGEGHCSLAALGWQAFKRDAGTMGEYLRRHLAEHLLGANRTSDFCTLLVTISFTDLLRQKGEIVGLLRLCDGLLGDSDVLSVQERGQVARWLHSTPEDVLGRVMYLKNRKTRGETVESWSLMTVDQRSRWWRNMSDVFKILDDVGLAIRPLTAPDAGHMWLSASEVESCAENEHKRWCQEMKADGWIYAPEKDRKARKHNMLIPWTDMPGPYKNFDRNECASWPSIFAEGGYEIYRPVS